jgi:DNA-binding beta-propeller fold protein YncE
MTNFVSLAHWTTGSGNNTMRRRISSSYIPAVLALLAVVAQCTECLSEPIGEGQALVVPTGTDWLRFVDGANMPVNIAPYRGKKFFVTAYTAIFLVDLELGTTKILPKPSQVETWNPTGVQYNSNTDLLYVANYSGRNVLVLRLADNQLELEVEITHTDLRSPEGIAVTESGDAIAVADYDGNSLSLFESDGQFKWSKPVANAHGVCFSHDETEVLVTSLKDRCISKFAKAGKLLQTNGSQGWGRDSYLWPTSIAKLNGNKYLVCDAHTGQLSVLNDQLEELETIGGNGPGAGLFNMPYHAILVGDEIVVADAYKHRIVAFNTSTRQISRALYWKGRYSTQDTERVSRRKHEPMGAGYEQYEYKRVQINLKRYIPNLPSELVTPGYNTLRSQQHVYTMDGAEPLLGENGFYFTQPTPIVLRGNEHFLVLTCPQRSYGFVLGDGLMAAVPIGLNHWVVDREIVSDFQTKEFSEIVRFGIERIQRFQQSKREPKVDRVREFLLVDKNELELRQCFFSKAGKAFYFSLANGDSRQGDQYFTDTLGRKNIPLFEWCLVNSLSGE